MTADRRTTRTEDDVAAYLDAIGDAGRQADARAVLELVREVTGVEPSLWGDSIIGFGRRPYTTADGQQREWFAVGLSARKSALTLYGLIDDSSAPLLERLGPHTTGTSCLYLRRLDRVDTDVLRELVALSWSENHR